MAFLSLEPLTEAIVAVRAITQIWSMIMIPVKSRKRRSQLAEWGFGWPPKNLHANTKNLERHTWHKRKVQYLVSVTPPFQLILAEYSVHWIFRSMVASHGIWRLNSFFFPEKGWNFCWVNIGVLSCKAVTFDKNAFDKRTFDSVWPAVLDTFVKIWPQWKLCFYIWIPSKKFHLLLAWSNGRLYHLHASHPKKTTHCLRSGWRCPRLEFDHRKKWVPEDWPHTFQVVPYEIHFSGFRRSPSKQPSARR